MSLFDKACVDKKLFLILLLASILVNVAVLPYAFSLGLSQMPKPIFIFIAAVIIQTTIMFSIFIFIGLFLGNKVGLGAPVIEDWLAGESIRDRIKPVLIISIVLGLLVGILLFVLYRFAFAVFVEPVTASQAEPPLWQRFLVCFYGGIGEEIAMRLFLMTLIVWISYKIVRTKDNRPTNIGVWSAIIIISVIFGLGHLPMTAQFMTITPVVVIRAIVLNGIAGVVFGWLYWKRGLESAIISHFSADIILHVVLPSLY
ncbi:MAG: CPBP family intramembrane glutamic endopeptidase [Phycisphaerae bacterium]